MGSSQATNKNIYYTAGALVLISSIKWFKPLIRYISSRIVHHAKEYARFKRPNRIILVRHGESEANVDHSVYSRIPDNKISLTEKGRNQAEERRKVLKSIVNHESVKFLVSPYERGIQTFEIIKKEFDSNQITSIIEPRLREQEFGNLRNKDVNVVESMFDERKHVGKFYYRFLNGESGADVYDRASLVLDAIFRSIDTFHKHSYENLVLICHGLFMRLFIMRFFKLSVQQFDLLANPSNCEIWVIEKTETGGYKLITELKEDPTYSD